MSNNDSEGNKGFGIDGDDRRTGLGFLFVYK
jgi:hypothetical protein